MPGSQQDNLTSTDAAPDFASQAGGSAGVGMRLDPKIPIAVIGILVPGLLWCVEPWQRPGFPHVIPDAILLSLASVGLLGLALVIAGRRKTTRRWRWVLAVCVCGFALLGGARLLCGKLALSTLESRVDQIIALPPGSVSFPDQRRNPISSRLVDALKWLGLGVPDWLSKHAEYRSDMPPPKPEQLIAPSRWPLRRAMADSMVTNDTRARFLMQHWKDYFPAIIGADVSLEHRREWMSLLKTLREDDSLTASSRQAAVFCMALVILTDPPEFENWRVPVRDAMLGGREPLPPRTEDVWMRTIDTLLAMDPPESWVALTEPLTANPDHLPYAMQVPVRGLAGNFDALSREFELFESRNQTEHGFALWLGAGASLEAWPDAFEKSEAARIRHWRRDVLFRWLMDHSRGTRKELAETKGRALLEFTPEQQQQLATSAGEWARLACGEVESSVESAKLTDSRPLMLVRLLCPYLTDHQQSEIRRLLIPVMLRPELFQRKGPIKSVRFDPDWVEWLWKIQPLMNADQRKTLQTGLAPFMGNLFPSEPSSAVLLCLDAWSDMPALSAEKWLALASHFKPGWKIVPRNNPREPFDPLGDGPLPIPPLDEHAVETLARHLDAAFSTRNKKKFSETLDLGLNEGDSTAPPSTVISHCSYNQVGRWQSSGILGLHPVAELFKMELYLKGLSELDDGGLRTIKEFARNGRDPFHWGWWLRRAGNFDSPWSDVLRDPQMAAQETVRLIEQSYYDSLTGLLFSVEKSPPDAAVVRAIWDALRRKSQSASIEHKTKIFGVLFRMSHLLPRDERLAMRRDFLTGFHAKEISALDFTDDDSWGVPWDPLLYSGGGMGIPWEDDELSAALSLSSNLGRLTRFYPAELTDMHSNSTFRFLALGVLPRHKINPRSGHAEFIKMRPLTAPFEPTPWQRARELHLHRPDLDQW